MLQTLGVYYSRLGLNVLPDASLIDDILCFFYSWKTSLLTQDYKATLHLPATNFPMRGDLPKREPARLARWEDSDLYARLRAHAKGRPVFVLHDGPPYANGAMHLGHAVNKVLKDIIIKSRHLDGYDAPYIPGWDCHGLPIEIAVEKKFGKVGVKLDASAFRHQCRAYASEQMQTQSAEFRRLGVIADWRSPYSSLDRRFEANEIRALARMIDNGHLSRGVKPVHWCFDCGSALAEAEIDYEPKTSWAIDVAYLVQDSHAVAARFGIRLPQQVVVAVPIWTTTPWTLPASFAVALAADVDYVLVEGPAWNDQPRWLVIAASLVDAALARYGVTSVRVLGRVKGLVLEGLVCAHPLYPERAIPLLIGDHVSDSDGTGAVHTAPGHGQEDFVVCQKYDLLKRYTLGQINPVDARGCYLSSLPPLLGKTDIAGTHVWKAVEVMIASLQSCGALLAQHSLTHSYPHCWRHKTPIAFRATPQWFISMDQANLRSKTLAAISQVRWYPQWGQERIAGMISSRPDWTISRQRTWGVPIPLIIHRQSGELHPDTVLIMEEVASRVELYGIDVWDTFDPTEIVGESAAAYDKVTDTLDVWFDSGVTHYTVLNERGLSLPADVYLEGSDQHRGWFQSAMLTSVAMNGIAPYRECITHGFTVDAQGRKMSKSLGNGIEPQEIIKTLGADILRLWIASTDYSSEMSLSEEILKRTSDAYRRIRNTARFFLGNLNGFDPHSHLVAPDQMVVLDRWILHRASLLQAHIIGAYTRYEFADIVQRLLNFCSVDLGALYLDIVKDRLYTLQENAIARRSAQTALYHLLEAFVRWIAPIMSFTADELWDFLPQRDEENVLFTTWYHGLVSYPEKCAVSLTDFDQLLALRDSVTKVLEPMRAQGAIGSALSAEITLLLSAEQATRWRSLQHELRFLFISGDVDFKLSECAEIRVEAYATTKPKCARCWQHQADIGQLPDHPELCGRCITNLNGVGEERLWF